VIRTFKGWSAVAACLETRAATAEAKRLNDGQRATLRAIANRIDKNSVLVADEVGMGKTRIAVEVAQCVTECDGRVAILVPPGLGYQWQAELREGSASRTSTLTNGAPTLLRSLEAFLDAWGDSGKDQNWFDQPIVLLSHAFTNWRLGESSEPWRWALLPELYARARKAVDGRLPREYHSNEKLSDQRVHNAANTICNRVVTSKQQPAFGLLERLKYETPWPGALAAAEYSRNSSLRPWLERAVGLGLGSFDLVVLDEAHKSRGLETCLSRLLNHVVLQHEQDGRRLAITATPVELDESQWSETLGRIKFSGAELDALMPRIKTYAASTRRLRVAWRTSEEARCDYALAADAFQRELSPYLLRRDKREDPIVRQFGDLSGLRATDYRQELEIPIETAQLSPRWKQIVCAAESLSIVTRQADSSAMKRLRLTVGNGHGIAALLDQGSHDDKADRPQDEHDSDTRSDSVASPHSDDRDSKRERRAVWWRDVIATALASYPEPNEVLFDHPAILAAVAAIEAEKGEKVLVFGRFTRPMRVLVDLLNAREMLRRLKAEEPWPRAKVPEADRPAVLAALRELNDGPSLDEIDSMLARRYERQRREREKLREGLLERIEEGLPMVPSRPRALLGALKTANGTSGPGISDERDPLVLLTRALSEYLGETALELDWATAFTDVMEAVTDRDEGDTDGDGQLDPQEASALWGVIEQRLHEEYNRPEGGFARLMNGETRQASRRMLQLAFNRDNSFPRVLVAQSLVGREGLNLHQACRTVVLLHPEWNPGVVEQQIGRVDRVGSLWETLMKARGEGDPFPRIRFRPVVFRGTYDEHNWRVLRARWDDYRAQLHGEVVPSRLAADDHEGQQLAGELARRAPNFSPTKVTGPPV
jgi:superfamily II DNA or RNA helicase